MSYCKVSNSDYIFLPDSIIVGKLLSEKFGDLALYQNSFASMRKGLYYGQDTQKSMVYELWTDELIITVVVIELM